MVSTLVLPVLKIHLQWHRPQEPNPGGCAISHSLSHAAGLAVGRPELWGDPGSHSEIQCGLEDKGQGFPLLSPMARRS